MILADKERMESLRSRAAAQHGFTLLEVLVVSVITSIVLSLSAIAVRHFWFVQALESSTDGVTTQMRQAQQQSESESHPLVYGVWFIDQSSRWGTLQYDPDSAAPLKCAEIGKREFATNVRVKEASFDADTVRTPECRNALAAADITGASSAQIAFFYARGTATPGSVTLEQTGLDRSTALFVTGITGRVSRP